MTLRWLEDCHEFSYGSPHSACRLKMLSTLTDVRLFFEFPAAEYFLVLQRPRARQPASRPYTPTLDNSGASCAGELLIFGEYSSGFPSRFWIQFLHRFDVRGWRRLDVMFHRDGQGRMPHQRLNDSVLYPCLMKPGSESTAQCVPSVPLDLASLERTFDRLAPKGCQVERLEIWTLENPSR